MDIFQEFPSKMLKVFKIDKKPYKIFPESQMDARMDR